MSHRSLVCAVAVLLAASTSSGAQMCVGSASFAAGPVRVAADARFGDNVKGFGANVAFGAPQNFWVTGEVTKVDYDDVSESATVFGATGGYSMPMNPEKTIEFCPVVSFNYQTGPNFSSVLGKADISDRAFGLGGSFGGVASTSPSFDFIPFAGGQFVMDRGTVKINGSSTSDSQNFGVISVGAGFVLNKTVTIRPIAEFPVGLDGAKPSYGIGVGFNFGK
jgi:hypothetical protein